MAIPAVFHWPVPDPVAIAQLQNVATGGSFVLNGTLVSLGTVTFPGFARTVSLSSTHNRSSVMFTISGILNGAPVSQTIPGPNNDTVETTQIFDVVQSITVDSLANNVNAGTGKTGRTPWFNSNYHATVANMAIQVVVAGTIAYEFRTTLDDVQFVPDANITTFTPIPNLTGTTAMPGAKTTQLGFYANPARYSNITIISSGDDGALTATFLQQGIT